MSRWFIASAGPINLEHVSYIQLVRREDPQTGRQENVEAVLYFPGHRHPVYVSGKREVERLMTEIRRMASVVDL